MVYRRHMDDGPAPDDRRPSEVVDDYWLFAHSTDGRDAARGENGGKWLVFVPIIRIDEVWAEIKRATELGQLGGCSKVASARPNRNAVDPNKRVICVYTADWTDEREVMRVRERLRELGVSEVISYKSDEDTLAGHYSNRGHRHISKYRA